MNINKKWKYIKKKLKTLHIKVYPHSKKNTTNIRKLINNFKYPPMKKNNNNKILLQILKKL